MIVISIEISIGMTGCTVGIDEWKYIVIYGIQYRRALWRAQGIINNEDLALYVLEHDWLGFNDTKNKNEIQQACFP